MPTININGQPSPNAGRSNDIFNRADDGINGGGIFGLPEGLNARMKDPLYRLDQSYRKQRVREENTRNQLLAKANRKLARWVDTERYEGLFGDYGKAKDEDRIFDQRKRLLQRINKGLGRVAADAEHESRFGGYKAAHDENRARDRARDTQERNAYANMRYNADQDNRAFDRQEKRRGFAFEAARRGARWLGTRGGPVGRFGRLAAGAMESGVLEESALAGPLGLAVGAGVAAWEAPRIYSGVLGGLNNAAAPWYNLKTAAALAGRQGGFEGNALIDSLHPDQFRAPAWMEKYNVSAQSAIGLARAAGQPISSFNQLRNVDQSLMAAQYAPYLGANDLGTIEGMTKLFTQVSGSGNNPNAPGNFGNAGSTSMGQVNDFYRKWAQLTRKAMTEGIDASTVSKDLSGLTQQLSFAGLANVSGGATTGFIAKMMSSGLPSMRNGAGILDAAGKLNNVSASAGLGGNSIATMAFQNEVNKRGGAPKTMAAMEKMFGFSYANLSPAAKYEAKNALSAAKNGDMYAFASLAAPFVQPSWQASANADWSKAIFGNSYTGALATAGQLGGVNPTTLGIGAAYATGSSNTGSRVALGWSDVSKDEQANIRRYAAMYGVSPAIVASVINHESGFNAGQVNTAGGGFGAVGLGQIRDQALADVNKKLGTHYTFQDLLSPGTNTLVTAAYLGILKKRFGSMDAALQHYGDGSPNYASVIESGATAFGGNALTRQNKNLADQNAAQVTAAHRSAMLASGADEAVSGALTNTEVAANALASVFWRLVNMADHPTGAFAKYGKHPHVP